ncbi:stalk domain-containing protein [Acetivibrio saccincola]|uniref:Copper amine oxidase n=3 Tax=Acetivibrio saccincola TaxID=1677857 RepID=A0A2S8R9R9_9FIRM|nr:stalk domain-containing protein [Acetivibrio saccincola]PQQ66532.1 copper amine oxidase [Acetivibrio saccincola]
MRWGRLAIVLLLFFCVFAMAQGKKVYAAVSKQIFITVEINGNYIKMDVQPYIANGRTYVPLRFVAEALGADVQWNQEEKKASVSCDDNNIEMFAGSNVILVNGEEQHIDTNIEIVDGRIMIPIRFIAENLGCSVEWDDLVFSVIIEKEGIEVPQEYIYEREYTDEDLIWLARIVNVEGGRLSLDARLAIANVVLNRKESPRFPNSIYDVIFDTNYSVQFPPAHRPGFKEMVPSKECITSAKMALEGINNIGNALFFNNVPFKSRSVTLHKIIDGMYFYY